MTASAQSSTPVTAAEGIARASDGGATVKAAGGILAARSGVSAPSTRRRTDAPNIFGSR